MYYGDNNDDEGWNWGKMAGTRDASVSRVPATCFYTSIILLMIIYINEEYIYLFIYYTPKRPNRSSDEFWLISPTNEFHL